MVNKDLLKQWNKKFGEGTAVIGVSDIESRGTFSLGTPALDFMLYNSLPAKGFIEFSGQEHSGKTTAAFLTAADFIKKEKEKLEKDATYQVKNILFVDAECTADPFWAKQSTGYDMNDEVVQTVRIVAAGQSAEQYFDMCIDAIKTDEFGLIIFDSLTAIVKGQIADSSMEKMDMGGIAKPLGDFTKKANGLLNRYGCLFIGIMGETQNISGYGNPWQTPGGTTWKRMCSVRIKFKKGELFDENDEPLKSTASNPAGHVIEAYLQKSKVCRSDRKLAFVHLNYIKGIDLLWDLIDVATVLGLIDNSVQGSFKFVDPDTGEIISDNGEEVKIRGKKNVKPYLLLHPAFTKRLYAKVYELLAKKDVPNVVSFEQMLNIDVSDEVEENTTTTSHINIIDNEPKVVDICTQVE